MPHLYISSGRFKKQDTDVLARCIRGLDVLLEVPQGNTTHMLMHLVSYVLGAAGEQRLPPGQPHVNTA